MKIESLDSGDGRLGRLGEVVDGLVVVREGDLIELERRYHAQRETIREYSQFAIRVWKLIDRGIGELGDLRDAAYEVGNG